MQLPQLRDKEQDVMAIMGQVSRSLERLEGQYTLTTATISSLQRDLGALPSIVQLDRHLDTLTDLMNRVDSADTQLSR